MPALWASVGIALELSAFRSPDGRWWLVGVGTLVLVIGCAMTQLDWARTPVWFVRPLPYVGVLLLGGTGLAASGAGETIIAVMIVAMMWSGFALERLDVGLMAMLCSAALFVDRVRQFGAVPAAMSVLPVAVVVVTAGLTMNWLRARMDGAAREVARAQAETAETAELSLQAAEQERLAEARRAAEVAEQLGLQSRLQQQVAEQAARLSDVARQVSGNTTSAAAATEQMYQALQELTRAAAATEEITAAVVEQAGEAAGVIRDLESSSSQIMAASDVIQGIAEQTNLLALNATIESARAGEAGRGFAVVAAEVKDLARQSGENADSITRTLSEVRGQVSTAVERVGQIAASMADLSSHHATLAAALEEQAAAVGQVSSDVQQAADEVKSMADGIRALESVSGGH